MFTGIIELLGEIKEIRHQGTNIDIDIWAPFPEEIKVDQSIAHDGVCLTVTDIADQAPEKGAIYSVTAVQETLDKTMLNAWTPGRKVNIERCLRVGDRLDGHFVQGHVDAVGKVLNIETRDGSWMYEIGFDPAFAPLMVDKGSVSVNGVSLTIVRAWEDRFSITIIPYTYDHTSFQELSVGDQVNLEFDVLGKYIQRMLEMRGIGG